MGFIASPTSQQHMTAGFILVTIEHVVFQSFARFLRVDTALACLDAFQSMLTKIMFTSAALCSNVPMPEPTDHAEAEDADNIVLLVESATA
jgi:hypothetical protein